MTVYGSLRNIFGNYFRTELMDAEERESHDSVHQHVSALAKRMKRSPAHVVLRWQLQQGLGVMPRASSLRNLESNKNVFDFDLTAEDIALLNVRSKSGEQESGEHETDTEADDATFLQDQ